MTQLSKNLRTHKIILQDWEELHITQAQYELYREEVQLKKPNEFITIYDIDTDKILYDGKVIWIKEFKHKNTKVIDNENLYWRCDYWLQHKVDRVNEIFDECTCYKKIWIIPQEFFKRLKEMWYWELLPYEVTNEIIKAYKNKYLINWEYVQNK